MIPYSWDGNAQLNDNTHFAAYFLGPELGLPEVTANMVARHGQHPLIGGISRQGLELLMEVEVLTGSADTLRAWFDAEDETPKVLVVVDENGTNARYWLSLCTSFMPTASPYIFLAKLRVHGDVRLRSVAPTSSHWDVTSSGATTTVTNGVAGINDEAYPVITITPRDYASGINPFRRFVAVGWRATQPAIQYPVDVVNDGLDTQIASTNFASAAGDDIRVYVDGVEVDYWLDGANTATTKVWVNLNWQTGLVVMLSNALGTGAISTLTVMEDISWWPSSGLFMIDSEVFLYTGKINATKTFTGVTRASRGTSAASHDASDAVTWVQHEIWIEYGDGGKAAIVPDDDYKPMFLLTSTNGSWDYDDFEEIGVRYLNRSGAWVFGVPMFGQGYGANQYTLLYPASGTYSEIGLADGTTTTLKTALSARWGLFNPCGISAANFQNGEFYHGRTDWFKAYIRSALTTGTEAIRYTIPASTNVTWNSWSQNVTSLPAGTHYVALALEGYGSSAYSMRVECADVTITLDSNYTPLTVIGAEENTYRLRPTITNVTTGESITLDAALDVDEGVEIDVANAQVTLLTDGTAANNLVTMVEGVRRWLLRLQPGVNTLRYDETGVVDVDVDIEFERRYRV